MFHKVNVLLLSSTILLSILSDTCALNIDNALQHRQNIPVGTGATASVSPSSSLAAVNSAASQDDSTPSSVNSPAPASPTVAEQTTNDQSNDNPSPSTTTASQSATQVINQESTATVQGSTSSGPRSTITPTSTARLGSTSKGDQTQSVSISSRTQQYVTTVVTVSGSSTRTTVQTTSGVVPVSTFSATSTGNPSLNENEGGSSKSGLDSSQKRIVIGVVVGIGGAILLGGIAVVAWRIWGRKGRTTDDGNDLMDPHPGSSGREKRSSISGQSPFRSTLDQYHNQTGPVNTASNF
ncbi:MAG: hypothetical protein Q9166_003556 [cf. Caloplaca sp. 2 TL-2023]